MHHIHETTMQNRTAGLRWRKSLRGLIPAPDGAQSAKVMDTTLLLLVVAVVVIVAFDFSNGFHDTANLIATAVASRALRPAQAALIAGVGASERPRGVRWNKAQQIAWTWLLTVPGSAVTAVVLWYIFSPLLP